VTVLTLLYWLSNFIRHRPYVAASTADVDAPQFDVVSHSVRLHIGIHTLHGVRSVSEPTLSYCLTMAAVNNYRLPDPLRVTGSNVAEDWRRFREQYENYEIASDLTDKTQEKRAAVFLTCIGNEAYDVYRSMEFDQAADRKKLDPVIAAFEKFCIGAVNVTYERYVFNRRVQDNGERFDAFLGDVRRLARSCEFAAVEESMIRDRIVVGIYDETTRHKLLQVRELSLAKAIDICKASEAAGRQ